MKAIDEYIKNMAKCNNPCLKHDKCVRYNKHSNNDFMEDRNCKYFFEKKEEDTEDIFKYLKNMFGMK